MLFAIPAPPIGIQPSPHSAMSANSFGPPIPPSSTGGIRTGFGHEKLGAIRTCSPAKAATSDDHSAFIARTCSRATKRRLAKSSPWLSASSSFQPKPTPSTKRPPERRSSVATALAVTIGSRCATSAMPVPISSLVVTTAAAVSATNGSSVRLYSSASSLSPVGGGVLRLTGMCVCSGRYSEPSPRTSTSRARSSGRIERSVANIVTP